jgi:hypothetical protein
MARFWFRSAQARDRLRQHLEQWDAGTCLDSRLLARYDADRLHPSNGELYFVAHPGVVFAPNAFEGPGGAVRGMHGYLPDVPDNRGVLLLYDSTSRAHGSLGVVSATRLFPTCLALCGLDPSAHTALAPVRLLPSVRQWTADGDADAEARVARDLKIARSWLEAAAPASTIVVSGSFGRGEGGVRRDGDGPAVLNDYDFVVAGPDASGAAGLGRTLAATLGLQFCDVLPMTDVATLPASQLHFDLRYGSRVLAGDRRLLDRVPAYAPAEIPHTDAAVLLMNRLAGVMLVPLPIQYGRDAVLSTFAITQLTKALIAVGDAYLLRHGEYSSRYRERAARLAALAPALRLDRRSLSRVLDAYAYKCAPNAAVATIEPADFAVARTAMTAALDDRTAGGEAGAGRDDRGLWDVAVAAVLAMVSDREADDARIAAGLRVLGHAVPAATSGGPSLRFTILDGLVEVFLAGAPTSGAALSPRLRTRLDRLGIADVAAAPAGAMALETARTRLAAAWLATCH